MKVNDGTLNNDGNSFHGRTITTRVSNLIKLAYKFGYESEELRDKKVTLKFTFVSDCDVCYSIYGWWNDLEITKESVLTFNILSLTDTDSDIAYRDLTQELRTLNK